MWPPAPPQSANPRVQAPQGRIEPAAPAPPASAPPFPPPRSNRRRRPRHLRRIAAAAAGVVVLAGAGTAFALAGGRRVEQRETLTHEVTALSIDAGGGDVTVRSGASPGTVEVTRRARWAWRSAPSGRETWQGSTLAIEPDCPGICDLDYEVRVPDGVAVTAHTGSADIDLGGTLGAVFVEAGSGDVKADVTTSTLATRTGSGDIELRLGSSPTQLSANSGSGDIDIWLPSGQTYAVDFQTGSGDTEVNVQQQSTSDHHVQVRTGSGDIMLEAS